jgi:hypothetical protein
MKSGAGRSPGNEGKPVMRCIITGCLHEHLITNIKDKYGRSGRPGYKGTIQGYKGKKCKTQ